MTVTAARTMADLVAEQGLSGGYPETWDDFVGQEQVKRQLRVAAQSAKMRGVPMGHTLIGSGMAGHGKTTLALLTAAELGTGLQIVTGNVGLNDARVALSSMNDCDVLFIDEFHQLLSRGKTKAEWLLHLMADGVLMGPQGPEEQPRITVLAATTDVGKVPSTFLTRFEKQPVLQPYSEDEAAIIAVKMAQQLLPKQLPWPALDDFRRIARAGSHNPRTIGNILSNLRDIAMVDPSIHDGESYDLTEALEWLGLSPDGLTSKAREYLRVLYQEFNCSAGERPLMDRLHEPGGLSHIEQMLLDRGLLARTRSGRVLTKAGIQRAREEL